MGSELSFSFAKVAEFDEETFVDHVSTRLAKNFAAFENQDEQILAWEKTAKWLHKAISEVAASNPNARVVFELSPPLELQRSDFTIISDKHIIVGEAKTGTSENVNAAKRQVTEYTKTIFNFVNFSRERIVTPVLVRPNAKRSTPTLSSDTSVGSISELIDIHPDDLVNIFLGLGTEVSFEATDPSQWLFSPRPSIVSAARLMLSHVSDRSILSTLIDDEELKRVIHTCEDLVARTKDNADGIQNAVIAVTGVPGAGKTLVGLRLAHSDKLRELTESGNSFPPLYLSGNGPLVDVLTEALIRDEIKRTNCSRSAAETAARAKIRLVHGLTTDKFAVKTHVLIFDEAQRAWTEEHMKRKLRRDGFGSEAEEILKRMENEDLGWSVVICLVGTGQQINAGERGLQTWVDAIERRNSIPGGKPWKLYVDDDVVESECLTSSAISRNDALNLRVVRRAENASSLGEWVNLVLEARFDDASLLRTEFKDFPILLTRDLDSAREWLREHKKPYETSGLLASSKSARLSIYGVDAHTSAGSTHDWPQWYLDSPPNLNSSQNLEIAASEFKCQGLELDWVGMCWSWDLVLTSGEWTPRKINRRSGRWNKNAAAGDYLINAYRVLLTRARSGMVIWVPRGESTDTSRSPRESDRIFEALLQSGCQPLEETEI
jgi:hypothetical protein